MCYGVEVSLQTQKRLTEIQFFCYQVFTLLLVPDLRVAVLKASGFNKFAFHLNKKVLDTVMAYSKVLDTVMTYNIPLMAQILN